MTTRDVWWSVRDEVHKGGEWGDGLGPNVLELCHHLAFELVINRRHGQRRLQKSEHTHGVSPPALLHTSSASMEQNSTAEHTGALPRRKKRVIVFQIWK
jgi:hypothetical protein